jgi:hypothetical protein
MEAEFLDDIKPWYTLPGLDIVLFVYRRQLGLGYEFCSWKISEVVAQRNWLAQRLRRG